MKGKLIIISWLASVSTLSLASSLAAAQSVPPAETGDSGAVNDTLGEKVPIDFAADQLTFDENTNVAVAEGNVFLKREDRVIHADRVIYDLTEGTVRVEGHIWARDKDGNILTAEHLVINDDFTAGMVENIGLILKDDSRFAARHGELQNGTRTEMHHAIYSPCAVCNAKGEKVTPVWSMRAVSVTHDQERKRVTYRDATLNAFGVPIMWTPYLSQPDPSVHSASGLLIPDLVHSSQLGYTIKLPIYLRISDDKDATVTPWMTSAEGPVLAGEYRQNVGFGKFAASGSITHPDQLDDFGLKTGRKTFRGHIFSNGQFDLDSLNEPLGGTWSWRYDVGWASDDTYLRRYKISDTDTIRSEVAVERFGERSYGALSALAFQGLRVEDIPGLSPYALPMAEYHYVSKPGQMGGIYRFDANGLVVTRLDGMDTRRISTGGSWELPYVGESGSVYTLGASIRGDIYNVSDSNRPTGSAYSGQDGTIGRVLPQLRLEWRLPMVKEGRSTRQTLEPIVAFVGSLNAGNPLAIPNEDSRLIGFDDTNLFDSNRFMGLDRWETGSRFDYGLRYGIESNKLSARFLIGQSYRFYDDSKIPASSGLGGHWSDVVGRAEVSYGDYVNLIYRLRLHGQSFALRRNEVDAIIGPKKFKVTLGYLDMPLGADDFNTQIPLVKREELRGGAIYNFAQYWSLSGNIVHNLANNTNISGRAGIIYEDECLRFGVFYDRSNTTDRDIRPETTILLKIALKNLG
ncbi:LPS-assembly protein LptD [Govanella unica]|uniref:LPS-assembly protein LptD n=1 Tax=Govanella unica TaxID=2975056 RepID=A0A9X3Z7N4_9PROT|nr:LPS assembly protein LptD [Govania unica]MDA5194357.1 LPS assembly protein LptD [Govania unica]